MELLGDCDLRSWLRVVDRRKKYAHLKGHIVFGDLATDDLDAHTFYVADYTTGVIERVPDDLKVEKVEVELKVDGHVV